MEEIAGIIDNTERSHKDMKWVDEEKKKVRKQKNAAKKEYKRLMRDETTEQEQLDDQNKRWKKLIRLHSILKKKEASINERMTRRENTRSFCKNPFEFVKENITDKTAAKNVTPESSLEEANTFFKNRYSDTKRSRLIPFPYFLPDPKVPSFFLDLSEPKDDEIYDYIKSRRNKSAPGPDGIPFKAFKMCSSVRMMLCDIIRKIFIQHSIPTDDRVAVKVLVPKSGSQSLEDFRDLTLFNTTLKTVMGVWARRVRRFMLVNKYFDTTLQKGFLPKISGCLEFNHTIVDIIKTNLQANKDAFIIWMDLKNAFGSIQHNLMSAALSFYGVPDNAVHLLMSLYRDCSVKVVTKNGQQIHLE